MCGCIICLKPKRDIKNIPIKDDNNNRLICQSTSSLPIEKELKITVKSIVNKKCIKNFFRLMIIFWIILFFAYPKGIKTGLFNLNYSTLIHCIFAEK